LAAENKLFRGKVTVTGLLFAIDRISDSDK
jgi:hypothetical protein